MPGDPVRYRVLGPLEVLDDAGQPVALRGELQRRLLAALLAATGRSLTPEQLVELLWPGPPPVDAGAALQTHVSRLRRAIGEGAVTTGAGGYRLTAVDDEVDERRFSQEVRTGLAELVERPAVALEALEGALARWRGAPYPELADSDVGRAEAVRLEELRLTAAEARGEALVALGRHRDALGDLEALVEAEPLRERARAQLMVALYRSGRQVDALRSYDGYRRRLADELGLEPSPELRALEQQILEQRAPTGLAVSVDGRTAVALDGAAPTPGPASSIEPAQPSTPIPAAAPGPPGPPGAPGAATTPSPTTAPAATLRSSAAARLPVQLTSFVGREEQLAELGDVLAAARLLTLVGPGGVGKTRLAVQLARAVAGPMSERVWLCELAAVQSGDAVAEAVATSLGVQQGGSASLLQAVVDYLDAAPSLIVLDNCEHLLDAVAPLVERLIGGTTTVTVLATSRERLAVEGEQVEVVAPLPVPDGDERSSPSVALFADRARAVRADFRLDEPTLAAAAGICRQLDGLPLAIELAAARAHTMDAADIAGALDHRFELLTAGRRTVGRHRSLRAAVSWSYDLLEPAERVAFERLSVFAGSFTIDAAAAVAELPPALAPELLAGLAERSLIARRPGAGRTRYGLLETLRHFGDEQLSDNQRLEARRRHAAHFLDLVTRLAPAVGPPGRPDALEVIDAEVAELRAVHQFLLDQDDVDGALRLVVALHWHGFLRMRPEVLEWAERSVALARGSGHPLLPLALASASLAAWKRGAHDRSAELARQAIAAAPFPSDPGTRRAWSVLGATSMTNGHLDEANEQQAQALELAAKVGDSALEVVARMLMVLNAAYAGNEGAVPLARTMVDALAPGEQSVSAAWSHYAAGESLLMAGEPSRAQFHLEQATTIAEAYGAPFIVGVAGASLASIEARQGVPDVAAGRFGRLLEHWRRAGEWSVLWTMIRSVSELLVRLGAHRDAAVLYGAVMASSTAADAYGDGARRLDEVAAELRRQLGRVDFEAARAEGAAQSDDATVLFAEAALERARR